ncbi:TetR/AcrR family transcriptional regulator [Pseudomonas sp. GX19020]|uniref:TetR/AcrR family transcriptional regulator n=1 Tax=Pseudomonadota TaxID=1224 RepID=UPI002019A95D|nr:MULTISPECIES: TetR/AcrR family transcriptional regulator [Pseudomonadota]MCL4067896.1 TetR/AcrR family transcriptional regulator [Pseudomonas sp. GX19020]
MAPRKTEKARPPQLRSLMTRQKLIDAAIEQLWESGYQKVTIAAISARAGVTHGAHLHHFGTREDLLAASVDALFQRSVAEYEVRMAELPRDMPARADAALEQLRLVAMGRIFEVVGELLLAARTNPELGTRMHHYAISQRALQKRMYELAFGAAALQDKRILLLLDGTFAIFLRGLATLKKTRSAAELEEAWLAWKTTALPVLLAHLAEIGAAEPQSAQI